MPDSISIDSLQLILTLSLVRRRLAEHSTELFIPQSSLRQLTLMVDEALQQHYDIMEKIHGSSE